MRWFHRSRSAHSDGSDQQAESAEGTRLLFRVFVGVVGLAAISGLAFTNYKMWKTERRLDSTIGQFRTALNDLDSSYISLRSDLAATAARLEVKHSPRDIEIALLDDYEALASHGEGFRDASAREGTPCVMVPKTAVIVTLGQSNAANHAQASYTPSHDVLNFNFYDGNCYRARDPLIGSSGTGGNFATSLGDMLIEDGLYQRVILAPIAIGGSIVEEWAEQGRFNRRILVLIRRLFEAGLEPTQILWHQGEGNSGLGDSHGRQYRKNLLEVIETFRRYGINAPFFVALATKCGDYPRLGGDNIREGQRSTVNPLQNIFLGPDTDTLGDEYRIDRCHFKAAGSNRHAAMWAEVLQAWAASNGTGR